MGANDLRRVLSIKLQIARISRSMNQSHVADLSPFFLGVKKVTYTCYLRWTISGRS